jgi:hypothetical protein
VESEPPYQYVRGNPVNRIDPSGMQSGTSYPVIPVDCVFTNPGDIRPLHCSEFPPVPEDCTISNDLNDILPVHCSPPLFPYILPFVPDPTLGSSYSRSDLGATIFREASVYGLPWQILTGVLESEIKLDTQLRDTFENGYYRYIGVIPFFRPDPGPGIGNTHITTVRMVSKYFEEYPDYMRLGIHDQFGSVIAHKLTDDQYNIKVVAAIVRQLADYRFGAGGVPLKMSHSNFSKWEMKDAVAVWHGFRYGVPGVSYGGIGFEDLATFQDRCYSLDELINNVVKGPNAQESARGSVPYFSKYFN